MSISNDLDWLLNSSLEEINNGVIPLYSDQESNKSLFSHTNHFLGNIGVVPNRPERPSPYYVRKSRFSSFFSIFDEPITLLPGSIIVVSLAFKLEHTGIYIGNNKVVELYGDGSINLISLEDFLMGVYKKDFPIRTGLEVFTACYENKVIHSEDVATRAEELIGKKIPYNIFKNNCHMLTGYCFSGKNFQRNTECRYFSGLTKKIIDSTLPKQNRIFDRASNSIFNNLLVGVSLNNDFDGGFSNNDLDNFSWKVARKI